MKITVNKIIIVAMPLLLITAIGLTLVLGRRPDANHEEPEVELLSISEENTVTNSMGILDEASEKIKIKSSDLKIVENGHTLEEVISRIGDPQGLFEFKETDTIFLYYSGDLKVELINGKVVNLAPDFNDNLKKVVQEKEKRIASESGKLNTIQKRRRLMKGKMISLLKKFKFNLGKTDNKAQLDNTEQNAEDDVTRSPGS